MHEASKPVFWEKLEKNINLPSAELAQTVVNVKVAFHLLYYYLVIMSISCDMLCVSDDVSIM